MSDIKALHKRETSLEDAFFLEQERKIIEQRRASRALEENKRNLASASGIRNEAVLDKLLALKMRPETLASLALVPLVEIAWCDGAVSSDERQAVLDASQRQSVARPKHTDLSIELLSQWLKHRPDPALFVAWEQYVRGLCELLSKEERESLRQEIMEHARLVARASGGVLGIATISAGESACLARIEAAFS